MNKFLLIAFVVLAPNIAIAAPATDEEAAKRGMEVLEMAQRDRDGGYEAGKLFAQCAGMYDALSKHAAKIQDGEATATNMGGYSNGAELVAKFFWGMYSENPAPAMEGIKDGAEMHYAAILSVEGVSDTEVTTAMWDCGALNDLQAKMIDIVRKSY